VARIKVKDTRAAKLAYLKIIQNLYWRHGEADFQNQTVITFAGSVSDEAILYIFDEFKIIEIASLRPQKGKIVFVSRKNSCKFVIFHKKVQLTDFHILINAFLIKFYYFYGV